MKRVALSKLEPNPWNANTFTEEEFEDLKTSIEETDGRYLRDNPLLVRPLENGELQIVDGEHRYRACKELGIEEIPVEVKEMSREKAIVLSVVLNKNRGELNYFKLSRTLNELYEPYSRDGMNQEELGKTFGFERSTVSHILQIYPRLKKCVEPHTFGNPQLQELARVRNPKLRRILVERVKERDWGSRTIRSRATRFNKLTDFLEEEAHDFKERVIDGLIEELDESLVEYDYSALKNEVRRLLKEELQRRIIHGDMFEEVPKLDRRFDCVITDPPYNVSWDREFNLKGRKNISQDKGSWDHYGKDEYIAFTEKWIEVISPVLKEGGALLVFTSDIYISYLIHSLREVGFKDRKTVVWKKRNPTVSVEQNNFVSSVEYIHYATKGKPRTFNWLGQNESHNLIETGIAKNPIHPTQKPVNLIKRLLKFVTNNGDWVLDPFAGSGSTAVACEELDRNWVMIEEKEKYVKMIRRRVTG